MRIRSQMRALLTSIKVFTNNHDRLKVRLFFATGQERNLYLTNGRVPEWTADQKASAARAFSLGRKTVFLDYGHKHLAVSPGCSVRTARSWPLLQAGNTPAQDEQRVEFRMLLPAHRGSASETSPCRAPLSRHAGGRGGRSLRCAPSLRVAWLIGRAPNRLRRFGYCLRVEGDAIAAAETLRGEVGDIETDRRNCAFLHIDLDRLFFADMSTVAHLAATKSMFGPRTFPSLGNPFTSYLSQMEYLSWMSRPSPT